MYTKVVPDNDETRELIKLSQNNKYIYKFPAYSKSRFNYKFISHSYSLFENSTQHFCTQYYIHINIIIFIIITH